MNRAVEIPFATSSGRGWLPAALAMVWETLDHAPDRADQADHRAEGADGGEVADPALHRHDELGRGLVHRLLGLGPAVREVGDPGAHELRQEGVVVAAGVVGVLELAVLDGHFKAVDQGGGTASFMRNSMNRRITSAVK